MANPYDLIPPEVPALRRYARALTAGNRNEADDLVQDTLERAMTRWHLRDADRPLRPWLFTVMHNLFVNRMESARLRHTVDLPDDLDLRWEPPAHEGRATISDVVAALGRLAPELRELLVLVCVEDLSYEEAARVVGIPVGTVMSRLARARARLKEAMDETPAAARLRLAVRPSEAC